MTSSRINIAFESLKQQQRMAFMPFITAGDPNMETTCAVIAELSGRGVDLIEIGFPYSDPVADGPVIQAAYTRALNNHLHVNDIFKAIGSLDTDNLPPLVAMVSYAIVFRVGVEQFLGSADAAGFAGLIIPDLPGDEAEPFTKLARAHHLDAIQLIAPTTPAARAERIMQAASGFVYCISVAGTTGERATLPPELQTQLQELRQQTTLPLAVGFGIGSPEQVEMLKGYADGVIVGSAIVRQMEAISADGSNQQQIITQIGDFATGMLNAIK